MTEREEIEREALLELYVENLVKFIRQVCSEELGLSTDHAWFVCDWREDETGDEALLRMFSEEAKANPGLTQRQVVEVLCHG